MAELTKNQIPQIAIIGMGCYLGGNCQGLDSFEHSIYEGKQHFIPLPQQRWEAMENQEILLNKYGLTGGQAPLGAYIPDWEINTVKLPIPADRDKFHPQDLLMLHVADQALQDAGISPGSRVAVVIVSGTKLELPESQPIKHSPIDQKLADHISQQWNFAGLALTLTAEQNSVFKALEMAQKLLALKEVDAVLVGGVELAGDSASVLLRNQTAAINTGVNTLSYDQNANGWMIGEGAAAIVLKLRETAKKHHNRIYAVIDALSLVENTTSQINSIPTAIDAQTITQACQQAFKLADIKPTDVNYLEVMGSGIPSQDESEIQGLLQAYGTSATSLTCALGSAKANVGHTYAISGLVSVVKTALCLYRQYIPVVPQWSSPKMPEMWQNSPFYVAGVSKPWFLEAETTRRIAAVNSIEVDGSYAHLILSEEVGQEKPSYKYLQEIPYYLFAIAGDDQVSLLDQIHHLQQTITDSPSLATAAQQTFTNFQKHHQPTYTLSLLARNQKELMREIQRALKGVKEALETGKDWQTPVGSYFTPKPLGKNNNIAFVYSGSFNAYVGIARYLFRTFPHIYDDLVNRGLDNRAANVEKLLYPRSLSKISSRKLEAIEQKLMDDPVSLLEFEVYFTGFITTILQDYFQIKPQTAFGYSLGENSMMFAQGVWNNFKQSSQNLNSSSLFKTRLAGSKNAIREYWKLSAKDNIDDDNLWSNYVLLCPLSQVRTAIKSEKRVYITLINTPEEVIISGEPAACQRVIKNLNCYAYLTPVKHVIHCEPMRSEYDEIARINTLPTQQVKDTIFYSAAEYKPISLDSKTIASNIAQTTCQELDFPRLVNRVYNDGSKIFVEVGVGGNCARWISNILQDKEHFTVALNKRGTDDHIAIIKALAKLLSHRVQMDLSPLYGVTPKNVPQNQLAKETITVDSLPPQHQTEKFLPELYKSSVNSPPDLYEILQPQPMTTANPVENFTTTPSTNLMNTLKTDKFNHNTATVLLSAPPTETVEETTAKNYQSLLPLPQLQDRDIPQKQPPNLRSPNYYKLTQNAAQMTQTHAALLNLRQKALHHISNTIQQQIKLQQNLFNQ